MLTWESATLTHPIQRCGGVGFGRVNAEEDVNGSVSGAVVNDLASVGTPMTTLCLAETDTGVINWASVRLISIPCVSRQTRR